MTQHSNPNAYNTNTALYNPGTTSAWANNVHSNIYTSITNTHWVTNNTTSNTQTMSAAKFIINQDLLLDQGFILRPIEGGYQLYKRHRHGDGNAYTDVKVDTIHTGDIDLTSGSFKIGTNTAIKLPNGRTLFVDKLGDLVSQLISEAREEVISVESDSNAIYESLAFCHFKDIHLPAGSASYTKLTLPDNTVVKLYPDDRVEIDDSDQVRIYKSRPSYEFNKFLNASDLLEAFIHFCADSKITKAEFKDLPIGLFITWLIVESAKADEDPVDDVLPLLEQAVQKEKYTAHRCQCCGRFLSTKYRTLNVNFCNSDHLDRFLRKHS